MAVAHDANALLGARFVRSAQGRATSAVTRVPPELSKLVDFVDAGQYEPQHARAHISTARFPTKSKKSPVQDPTGGPSGQDFMFAVVPEFLRSLYNASAAVGVPGSRQAAVEFPTFKFPDQTLSSDPSALKQWSEDVAVPMVTISNTSALIGDDACTLKGKAQQHCSGFGPGP